VAGGLPERVTPFLDETNANRTPAVVDDLTRAGWQCIAACPLPPLP
jgi:hypothetical protein